MVIGLQLKRASVLPVLLIVLVRISDQTRSVNAGFTTAIACFPASRPMQARPSRAGQHFTVWNA